MNSFILCSQLSYGVGTVNIIDKLIFVIILYYRQNIIDKQIETRTDPQPVLSRVELLIQMRGTPYSDTFLHDKTAWNFFPTWKKDHCLYPLIQVSFFFNFFVPNGYFKSTNIP